MIDFRLAVKAFLVHEDTLLVVQRTTNASHQPNMWELPGGRLEPGEDPFAGLVREVQEEVGIAITVDEPLSVRHFTRQDGQVVTLIVFVCYCDDVSAARVSDEHTSFRFVPLSDYQQYIDPWYYDECHKYLTRYS